MREVNLLARYPRAKRNLMTRKEGQHANRAIAREFGFEYFDGTRDQGYGGYRYDGRWRPIACDIADYFGLKGGDRVLDVGCAKGFLIRDLIEAVPGLDVWGLDVSQYAIDHCHEEARGRIVRGSAERLPFANGTFAAVLAINVIHNLAFDDCVEAVREIERLAPAYRNEDERECSSIGC